MAKYINPFVALESVRVVLIKEYPYVRKSTQLNIKIALKHIRKVETILEKFIN